MNFSQGTYTYPVDNEKTGNKPVNDNESGSAAQQTLTRALDLTRRAAELESIDELQYFLVNDLRILIDFDRCFLINHLKGASKVSAAANQPTLDPRSEIHAGLVDLSSNLRNVKKGLLLNPEVGQEDKALEKFTTEERIALIEYMKLSGAQYLFLIPLLHQDITIAHILMEFFDTTPPNQAQAVTILGSAPIFSSLLLQKYIEEKRPRLIARILGAPGNSRSIGILKKYLIWLMLLIMFLLFMFFWPMDVKVGGEAEIRSVHKNIAFCRMDGLIDKVMVTEGERVRNNQVLAILDPTDLNYRIESSKREYELLTKKLNTLSVESDSDPTKLAEAQLVELKRKKVLNDLKFGEWQQQFLDIRAPSSGVILTKDVQSISGKKLEAGEPFCEIGKPSELAVDVFVPDNRVSKVRLDQDLILYLNNDPLTPYSLKVDAISPTAETIPRLGNVCRVRAPFSEAPESAKIGMRGIGKIKVGESTPWELFQESMAEKLNKLSLYF